MLRPLTEADTTWLAHFSSHNRWPFHTEDPDDETVAERIRNGYFDGPGVETFVVEGDTEPVGIARVYDLDDQTPLFDLRISEQHRGQGLGGAALRELVEWVFNSRDVDRFEGTTRQDNVAMRRAFAAAGFVKEAHYRQAWSGRDGGSHDAVGYAILRDDWESGRRTAVDWDDEPASGADGEPVMAVGCLACDLTTGRAPLPGGLIHEQDGWRVEHCVGPLGVGTLIVKPFRHVTAVRDLDDAEAAALGPLLRRAAEVADRLVGAEQVYVCLWSHAGGSPGHIHWVVQPTTAEQLRIFGAHGPKLQMAMFEADVVPDPAEVERVADRARDLFAEVGR